MNCPLSPSIEIPGDLCQLNCLNNFGGVCRIDSVRSVQGNEQRTAALYGVRVLDVQRALRYASLALVADRFTKEVFSTPLTELDPADCADFVRLATQDPADFNTWNSTKFDFAEVASFLHDYCRLFPRNI